MLPLYFKYRFFSRFDNINYDWGQRCFLAKGKNIPQGVMIWGTVENVEIIQLVFHYICDFCEGTIEFDGEGFNACPHCGEFERRTKFFLK